METAFGWVKQALPVVDWLPGYDRTDARGDLTAGLTVGVMLIPQAMAYAVLAGVPPIYGLYAALVPLLIYPFLGSSRHLITGPVAIDMIVVAAALGGLAEPGSGRYIELAILLTLMVGMLQLGMGSLRLGFLANLLSRPVIGGFATAAALIIATSQVGNFLGVDLGRSEHFYETLVRAAEHMGAFHTPSVFIGGLSVVLIIVLRWWSQIFPAELAVIVGAGLATWGLGLDTQGVQTVGDVPTGLPSLSLPTIRPADVRSLVPTAISLALIQFMSVVSLGRIFASRHRYSIDANSELTGVGLANALASFFRCIPSSGSFSRTAVSEQAGGRTPLTNIVAAVLVAVALLFLPPLLQFLPLPALAAIIVVAAVGLVDVAEIRHLFRTKPVEGWVALLTLGSTLLLGIEEGLLLGIGAATVAVLYRQSRPHVAELGHLSATRSFKNLERFGKAYPIEGLMMLRIDAGFSFFNAQYLKDYILKKADQKDVRAVIIDGTSINDLDTTAVDSLQGVAETLEKRGIEMHFAGLTGQVRDVMSRSGLGQFLDPTRFHITPHRAVWHVLKAWDEEEGTKHLDNYERSTQLPEEEIEPTAETDFM